MTAPPTPDAIARRLTRERAKVARSIAEAFVRSISGLSLGQSAGLMAQLVTGVDRALEPFAREAVAIGIQAGADTTGTSLRVELTDEEADRAIRAEVAWAERERIAAMVRAARQPGPTWAVLEALAVRIERGEE